MSGSRRLRERIGRWLQRVPRDRAAATAIARTHGLAAVVAQQRRDPIEPPPPIFDLLLAVLFAWGGWIVWKKGRTWRSGALILWLLALAGLYTFSRSF